MKILMELKKGANFFFATVLPTLKTTVLENLDYLIRRIEFQKGQYCNILLKVRLHIRFPHVISTLRCNFLLLTLIEQN
jgi:hypothetical protein